MAGPAGALWSTCDPQPIQQAEIFSGPDNQAGLMSFHVDTPFHWGSEPWALHSRSDDIALMSPSLVHDISPYDSVLHLSGVSGDVQDLVCGNPKFRQSGQWGQSEFSYSVQDNMQDLLTNQFIPYNTSSLGLNHLSPNFTDLDCAPVYNDTKAFGTVTHNRAVPSTNTQSAQHGSSSMVSSNRPITSTASPTTQYGGPRTPSQTTQYGGSSMVTNSMEMFASAAPQGIMTTSGLSGGCNSDLMHLPKRQHAHSLPPTTGRDLTASEVVSGNSISNISGVGSFNSSQKSSASVMMSPLAASSHMHKAAAVSEELKMASFNPGPFVPTQKKQQHEQQDTMTSNRIWADKNNLGKISSSPIPIMGFEQSQQQSMSNSSPVTSLGFEQRQKMSMGSSPSITIIGFEQRQKQPMSSSSPISNMVFEPRQKQPMSSSSPISNIVFEQRQLPTVGSSPPISISGFEPKKQPSLSNSPPLSNLGFEQRLQPMSNASPISNLPFEQQRQQATMSNTRSAEPDSVESTTKWPLRMDGAIGGCAGLPSSQKAPVIMQPETGTMKCPIPRTMPSNAKACPAVQNANSVNKRPLTVDDKDQTGSMNKKSMQKFLGPQGCSRLESISALAHQKVSQSTTSGRALGPALNTNLKPRARQGSANDPQSIAARVRRERISERLKVLQALIPNGDKVDMVTMLEKAISYVQCLEFQIKMLKNDSLWPKALGPLPNTLQELLELAGPEFAGIDGKNTEESSEKPKKSALEVIELDGNQPSAD
ncbi:uncharacterized protein [Physcomitrium patens]|nr:uncharacterized protein LOC112292412 isoform X2 [Physcomitrium patens]XP_024396647.1 uncharacterized protein LOC112292412 isoform X2 [Physcomitrium patens]ABO84930.1 Rhd6-like 1 [Physcomitrium patens]PNR63374.1 hypothetical protein PHYPA_001800 [Physcomitrium patens]|eukprot:XP_024396639.1 uncharacterized protein LOC112292412 isoform X2 [Physcomitrella patens]